MHLSGRLPQQLVRVLVQHIHPLSSTSSKVAKRVHARLPDKTYTATPQIGAVNWYLEIRASTLRSCYGSGKRERQL